MPTLQFLNPCNGQAPLNSAQGLLCMVLVLAKGHGYQALLVQFYRGLLRNFHGLDLQEEVVLLSQFLINRTICLRSISIQAYSLLHQHLQKWFSLFSHFRRRCIPH
jgi:hypothetical protein